MNVLDEIVATKRKEIAVLKALRPLESLQKEADSFKTDRRPFHTLFEKGPVLIAEIKPRSPSAGELIADSPLEIADLYAKSDADVISVLTDADYFGGSNDLLERVRARVPQTILRKDFIIDEYQVYETLLLKADVYLLIAAILSQDELAKLIALGESLGLETLVEVHDEQDVEKALGAGAKIIGINNRDLTTFKTDIAATENLVGKIPQNIPVLSESGIVTAEDVKRVRALGIGGILVGTSVLQSDNPLEKINELKQALTI
ncbi:MAG: indole-3-glycerol phosphate synthase TrpC [Candidatus Kaiserbacteria bacterium]|nr:indole-3-glycerol phosphate synthase TrpC [Candidatus Kaiserbacteria bacterium]